MLLAAVRDGFPPAPTALRVPGHAPLGFLQSLLRFALVTWILHSLPFCRHQKHLQPNVSTRLFAGMGQWLGRHMGTGEGPLPAIRLLAKGDGLGGALKPTMATNGNASNLRQAEHPAIQDRAVAILGIGEGVLAVSTLEARIARRLPSGDSAEARLIRLVHPAQNVLQDLGMHRALFRETGFEVRQLRGLLGVGGADALPTSPPRAALFQGTVVEHATAPYDRFQRVFLCGRWVESVLIGFPCAVLFHTHIVWTHIFWLTGGKTENNRDFRSPLGSPAFIPMPEGQGSSAGLFDKIELPCLTEWDVADASEEAALDLLDRLALLTETPDMTLAELRAVWREQTCSAAPVGAQAYRESEA
jgi:hypothetical protein